MKVFTYLMQSLKNGGYYTGITEDLGLRIKKHNSGEVKSTAKNRPWKLLYSKAHESYAAARRHEKWLKKKNSKYKSKIGGVN